MGRYENVGKILMSELTPHRNGSFNFLSVQKRKKLVSEHQTKTGKECWRDVSPSQGFLESAI